jgi:hypothetical protein
MKMRAISFLMLVGCSNGLIAGGQQYTITPATADHDGTFGVFTLNSSNRQNPWERYGSLAPASAKNWVESLRENPNPTYVILSGLASFVGIVGVVNNVLKPMNVAPLFYYSMWAIAGSFGLQASGKRDAPWYRNPSTPPILGLLAGVACRMGWLNLSI